MRRLAFILIFLTAALCVYAAQSVKTVNGLAIASVKTMDQLAIASVKNVAGLDNTGSVSTSYTNTGGTGDRTGIITVTWTVSYITPTTLVNGNTSENVLYFINGVAASGKYILFDFGSGKVIDEAKWYQSITDNNGVWQWEGSNDAMSWTAIGSSFTLGSSATQTITELSGNTTSYRYYRINGVSGTMSYSAWLYEIEFKISS